MLNMFWKACCCCCCCCSFVGATIFFICCGCCWFAKKAIICSGLNPPVKFAPIGANAFTGFAVADSIVAVAAAGAGVDGTGDEAVVGGAVGVAVVAAAEAGFICAAIAAAFIIIICCNICAIIGFAAIAGAAASG